LNQLYPWIGHAQSLGTNALFLGPLFESSTHGYDTRDYYQVDRRLGDNPSFARFSEAVHQRGMRLCWMLYFTMSGVSSGLFVMF
jgi:cyclomaltodextrinase